MFANNLSALNCGNVLGIISFPLYLILYICPVLANKFSEKLEAVRLLFMQFGVKSMTMDDISRKLSISKKTLYNFVSDKNDLVEKTILAHLQTMQVKILELEAGSENAIDHNKRLTGFICDELSTMHPSVMSDLEKYYPKAWVHIEKHRNEFVFSCLKKNIERGVKEGVYRSDLQIELIITLHLSNTDTVLRGGYSDIKNNSLPDAILEVFRYHIRGIASDIGIAYLYDKIQNDKYEF